MAENREEIREGLKKVVQLVKKVEDDRIVPAADLKQDLTLDEVGRIEVLMMAERYFDVEFSESEIDYLSRFGDIANTIYEKQGMIKERSLL